MHVESTKRPDAMRGMQRLCTSRRLHSLSDREQGAEYYCVGCLLSMCASRSGMAGVPPTSICPPPGTCCTGSLLCALWR